MCTFAHGEHELNTPQPDGYQNGGWNDNQNNNQYNNQYNNQQNNQYNNQQNSEPHDPWATDDDPKALSNQNFGGMTFFG